MTNEQREAIESLRDEGYAVIVWAPKELGDAPPVRVEDNSIRAGWEIIEQLQGL